MMPQPTATRAAPVERPEVDIPTSGARAVGGVRLLGEVGVARQHLGSARGPHLRLERLKHRQSVPIPDYISPDHLGPTPLQGYYGLVRPLDYTHGGQHGWGAVGSATARRNTVAIR